jgi:hypothetical protein
VPASFPSTPQTTLRAQARSQALYSFSKKRTEGLQDAVAAQQRDLARLQAKVSTVRHSATMGDAVSFWCQAAATQAWCPTVAHLLGSELSPAVCSQPSCWQAVAASLAMDPANISPQLQAQTSCRAECNLLYLWSQHGGSPPV